MLENLFKSIDTKNTQGFINFITDDCVFQFGNNPQVEGKPKIEKTIDWFFNSIYGISHELLKSWETDEALVCHGNVTYTRLDKSTLTVPFANILYLRDGLINKYLIYVDTSQLY